ncbi:hypothetical protein [Paraburkholderia sp. SIMBA_030]
MLRPPGGIAAQVGETLATQSEPHCNMEKRERRSFLKSMKVATIPTIIW